MEGNKNQEPGNNSESALGLSEVLKEVPIIKELRGDRNYLLSSLIREVLIPIIH